MYILHKPLLCSVSLQGLHHSFVLHYTTTSISLHLISFINISVWTKIYSVQLYISQNSHSVWPQQHILVYNIYPLMCKLCTLCTICIHTHILVKWWTLTCLQLQLILSYLPCYLVLSSMLCCPVFHVMLSCLLCYLVLSPALPYCPSCLVSCLSCILSYLISHLVLLPILSCLVSCLVVRFTLILELDYVSQKNLNQIYYQWCS